MRGYATVSLVIAMSMVSPSGSAEARHDAETADRIALKCIA